MIYMPKKVKKITKENTQLVETIRKLNSQDNAIWKKVAYELCRPRRQQVEVNLNKIAVYANDGDTVLVPGKVLGNGFMDKKVTIAAFSFTQSARLLIDKAGAKIVSLEKLLETNPTGKGVIILK